MNRITSPHLPRAKALVAAFRDQRITAGDQTPPAKVEEARQRSPAGWPVPRARLAAQLQQRLDGQSLPNQQGTSYCGCAAFLYCLLEDRPDWYVAYATALWRGEPFTFRSASQYLDVTTAPETRSVLRQVQTGKSNAGAMTDLDWTTMASLSGATTYRRNAPSAAAPDDKFRAITWPWMVREWFASVGAPAMLDSVGAGYAREGLDELLALFARWESCWLVLQIDASMLNGGGTSIQQRHWVVVDPETRPLIGKSGQSTGQTATQFVAAREARRRASVQGFREAYGGAVAANEEIVRQKAEVDTAILKLRVVTWGDEHHHLHQPSLRFVLDRFHGGYAFPRFNRK